MKNSKKIMGAAGAAAAAATAVGIAAATMRNRKPTVLHVQPADEGWTLSAEGDRAGGARYDTKRAAVQAGRELADSKAPSRLVIHRRDNSIQKQHSYEKDS